MTQDWERFVFIGLNVSHILLLGLEQVSTGEMKSSQENQLLFNRIGALAERVNFVADYDLRAEVIELSIDHPEQDILTDLINVCER